MLFGDNEEVVQPFPLQMVPNTLYSCAASREEWTIFTEGKNHGQWKANLSALQHLKTTTAASTGINISLLIQVSITPHLIILHFKLADNTTASHQHKNGPVVDSRTMSSAEMSTAASSSGASLMLPAAGFQTDWLLHPPESASSSATISLSCQWPWNEVSMFSKLFPPPPSFLRGVWSWGQLHDTSESLRLQETAAKRRSGDADWFWRVESGLSRWLASLLLIRPICR